MELDALRAFAEAYPLHPERTTALYRVFVDLYTLRVRDCTRTDTRTHAHTHTHTLSLSLSLSLGAHARLAAGKMADRQESQGWGEVEVRYSDTLAQYYITGQRPPADSSSEPAAAAEPQPQLQPTRVSVLSLRPDDIVQPAWIDALLHVGATRPWCHCRELRHGE
jgi:hypothetical protein